MARIPGIELDEIYAKYELHPVLMDIYVEGEFDRDWLNCFLGGKGLASQVSIFTVDEVEVPNAYLLENGLPLGSDKQRLIALATLLSRRLGNLDTNVSCLVDADFDRILGRQVGIDHLLYTDFSCMEMYSLNLATLEKFITLTCNLRQEKVDEFLALLERVGPAQFCLRAVNEKLNLQSPVQSFVTGLRDKRKLSSFDPQEFFERYISCNNLHRRAQEISEEASALLSQLPEDIRHKCHGHDFIEILFEYIERAGALRLYNKNKDIVMFGGRLLAGVLDCEQVFSEPLFNNLYSTLSSGARLWPATK